MDIRRAARACGEPYIVGVRQIIVRQTGKILWNSSSPCSVYPWSSTDVIDRGQTKIPADIRSHRIRISPVSRRRMDRLILADVLLERFDHAYRPDRHWPPRELYHPVLGWVRDRDRMRPRGKTTLLISPGLRELPRGLLAEPRRRGWESLPFFGYVRHAFCEHVAAPTAPFGDRRHRD
jgi:hypothetical protein